MTCGPVTAACRSTATSQFCHTLTMARGLRNSLMSERYEFGKNWASFVDAHFSPERRDISKRRLLAFLKRQDLGNLNFLDIGSGSGLHSMAAHDAGAARVHSFDYDEMSVQTTARLRALAGAPSNWTVERGDVLTPAILKAWGSGTSFTPGEFSIIRERCGRPSTTPRAGSDQTDSYSSRSILPTWLRRRLNSGWTSKGNTTLLTRLESAGWKSGICGVLA